MMKYVKVILSVILISIVAYAGSGLSSYRACCDNCHIMAKAQEKSHSCCGEEASDTEQVPPMTHDCCIQRLSVDWISMVQHTHTYLTPSSHILFHDLANPAWNTGTSLLKHSQKVIFTQSQQPPNIHKSEYFSLLTVLII